MNPVWKALFASVIVASALLTACGKSGGSTASTPGSAASGTNNCVYDASGNCQLQTGPAGYMGDGQWTGRLTVNNTGLLAQFGADNGLCAMNTSTGNFGYGGGFGGNYQNCSNLWAYLNLSVIMNDGGCLPGASNFTMTMFSQNGQIPLRATAPAYMNPSSNGFMLNYTNGSSNATNQIFGNGYQNVNYSNGQTQGSMQINLQWTDGSRVTMNVQVYYRGQQIASGQLTGQSLFNQSVANQGTNFCGGTGTNANGANGAYGAYGANGYQNMNGYQNGFFPNGQIYQNNGYPVQRSNRLYYRW